jgi:hypothetical protein
MYDNVIHHCSSRFLLLDVFFVGSVTYFHQIAVIGSSDPALDLGKF